MNAPDRPSSARRTRPAGFFAPVLLAAFVLAAATLAAHAARAAEPDYTGYSDLLSRYLRVLGSKGQPWDSRFDYEQLYIDEKIWSTRRAEGLATIHTQLLSVTPASMTPRERTAWALNAYNLLVIERMTLHLLVPGRRFMRYDSPLQANNEQGRFFGATVATLKGRGYSLTGFERRFVYGDTATDSHADGLMPREHGGDPRLQFALAKASLCSGLLFPWVYRADSLEAQLDRAARLALALPRWIRLDAATGTFMASNRFFEERADFGGPDMSGLMPFLLKHGSPALKKTIQSRKLTRPSMFFEPDWKLNQFDHPAPKLPGLAGDSLRKG